jgi:hypothetical protein
MNLFSNPLKRGYNKVDVFVTVQKKLRVTKVTLLPPRIKSTFKHLEFR